MTTAPTIAVADLDRPASPGRPRMPLAAAVAIGLAWSVIIGLHASGHEEALDHDALVGEHAQLSVGDVAIYACRFLLAGHGLPGSDSISLNHRPVLSGTLCAAAPQACGISLIPWCGGDDASFD
jgi:hypothetical protein